MMKIEIVNHWYNDAGDTEIVLIKPIDESIKLQHNLFWFSGSNRLLKSSGTQLTSEEFCKHKCYKQKTFTAIKNDIPNDCYMPIIG